MLHQEKCKNLFKISFKNHLYPRWFFVYIRVTKIRLKTTDLVYFFSYATYPKGFHYWTQRYSHVFRACDGEEYSGSCVFFCGSRRDRKDVLNRMACSKTHGSPGPASS